MSDLEPPDTAPDPPTRRRDRRTWLKEVGAAGAGAMIAGPAASQPASTGAILPRTSTSDVFVPPRGRGFMKFSFDFPEPSVAFGGYEFGFRVFTHENTYSLVGGVIWRCAPSTAASRSTCTGSSGPAGRSARRGA